MIGIFLAKKQEDFQNILKIFMRINYRKLTSNISR